MERLIILLVVLLLIARIIGSFPDYKDGDTLRISAQVTSEPRRTGESQIIKVEHLYVRLPAYPEIIYGDSVVIEGRVKYPYLEDPLLVSHSSSPVFLYHLRERILEVFQKGLPHPHSGLVAGVVIGSRRLISKGFYEELKQSGTAHVVVASGMNVSFVAQFLVSTLILFVNRKKAIGIALIGIWFYVFMSGFDAPLVRAGVMGTLAYGAQAGGRLSSSVRALLVSGAGMLLIFPHWISDLGFVLSFLATFSLILFERPVNRLIHFVPGVFREGLSTSLAAQIGVAPILITSFGYVNPLGPIINALVLWTIPPIMIIGAIAGLVGLVVPLAGEQVLLLVYPFTLWFVSIVTIAV